MKKTGYTVVCENCGEETYQTKTQYNKSEHHFCSNKCSSEFRNKNSKSICQCEYCGKSMKINNSSQQRFCSRECQGKWQSTITGEDNPRYKRIYVKCENCDREISLIESNVKRFKHHFCCNDCRKTWYKNTYSQTDERKEESRINATKYLEMNKTTTLTKPQKIINQLLNEMQIEYMNEYNCKYYSIDNYLCDFNLMIEIMGDFWHCNPMKYPNVNQDIQRRRVSKDKAKHTYIKNQYNIEILYLWEDDIYNNIFLCKLLISKYIESQGLLKNYHSFNYLTTNNQIILKESITDAFFNKRDIIVNA